MKGGLNKLKVICKLLVGITGVIFFGDKENCEEKYRRFLIVSWFKRKFLVLFISREKNAGKATQEAHLINPF
jgi:hypothetical protein